MKWNEFPLTFPRMLQQAFSELLQDRFSSLCPPTIKRLLALKLLVWFQVVQTFRLADLVSADELQLVNLWMLCEQTAKYFNLSQFNHWIYNIFTAKSWCCFGRFGCHCIQFILNIWIDEIRGSLRLWRWILRVFDIKCLSIVNAAIQKSIFRIIDIVIFDGARGFTRPQYKITNSSKLAEMLFCNQFVEECVRNRCATENFKSLFFGLNVSNCVEIWFKYT